MKRIVMVKHLTEDTMLDVQNSIQAMYDCGFLMHEIQAINDFIIIVWLANDYHPLYESEVQH